MAHVNRLKLLVVSALLGISVNARALIIYDTAASTDNTKNVIDPANSATYPVSPALGVPWQYVVRYGVNNASAVYIGNGYLLTARHVGTSDTGLLIQGTNYNRDTSFSPLPITIPGSPAVFVDLQLQKISDDSDGDGIPLLMEYALGLDPTADSTAGLPVASVEGSDLVLTFSRLASATDVKVAVETSSTLQAGEWTVEPATITVLDGATVFQKVKASVPLGGADRKFARLKVTRL